MNNSSYSRFFELITIASEATVPISDEPPAETKGSGTPVIGNSPMFIPMCTNVSANKIKNIPATNARAVGFIDLLTIKASL